jgi:hypothetical protein
MATMTARFRSAPHVYARRFDHETVLLSLTSGQYFALDDVGGAIWELLTSGKTLDETVTQLLAEYEVDEAALCADVQRIAGELIAAGLLSGPT